MHSDKYNTFNRYVSIWWILLTLNMQYLEPRNQVESVHPMHDPSSPQEMLFLSASSYVLSFYLLIYLTLIV